MRYVFLEVRTEIFKALFEAVDDSPSEKVRPCDLLKLIKFLKLIKTRGTDGISNESLRHLPRRQVVYLAHLFNHCFRLSHFPSSWEERKAKAKVKVKLSCALAEHHAMKAYWKSGGIAPLIL
jgi:hypothetical protein